ncbi:heavy metal-binding domain-containing protein [Chitinophaga pendula]|uniref:YbjQ family protein n=1 Tax=Chitinophaga TaxID=79328 RepID=UPI000BAEFD92|nr:MULTISPECIES: heavy metal-binding domain-containing protein [Chitinophaga]ASZ13864.1 hypothetical protein CK934_24365 [Chitinophaga sp. MD30]UCJ08514.1 heavy metal-binding domain-containing protein [Chitinophaga pendula]
MAEYANCPNCDSPIKSGLFNSNELLNDELCLLINEFGSRRSAGYCKKCGTDLSHDAMAKLREIFSDAQSEVRKNISNIPIVTTHSPFGWQYRILGMASGQSTTGTGLFSEFTASWTDLFGMQSSAYNEKIANGESLCASQLRSKAVAMGGNAIIAADIDYSELGAGKGMIMVCMSGTVVRLENLDVLEQGKIAALQIIKENSASLSHLNKRFPETIKAIRKSALPQQ